MRGSRGAAKTWKLCSLHGYHLVPLFLAAAVNRPCSPSPALHQGQDFGLRARATRRLGVECLGCAAPALCVPRSDKSSRSPVALMPPSAGLLATVFTTPEPHRMAPKSPKKGLRRGQDGRGLQRIGYFQGCRRGRGRTDAEGKSRRQIKGGGSPA